MKKAILLFCGFIFSSATSGLDEENEEREFDLNCKVLDQTVLVVGDGKSKKYDGREGLPRVGDYLRLKFKFNFWKIGAYNVSVETNLSSLSKYFSTGSSPIQNDRQRALLRENYFELENEFTEIRGLRYYKNDWNVLARIDWHEELSAHIIAANCLNMPVDYSKMLDKISDHHKN